MKVEEAMNVYDEYIKHQSGGPMGGDPSEVATNGTENVDPAGEEGKAAE